MTQAKGSFWVISSILTAQIEEVTKDIQIISFPLPLPFFLGNTALEEHADCSFGFSASSKYISLHYFISLIFKETYKCSEVLPVNQVISLANVWQQRNMKWSSYSVIFWSVYQAFVHLNSLCLCSAMSSGKSRHLKIIFFHQIESL